MTAPSQMFTHELNGVKGFIPAQPWVVDKTANVASGVTLTNCLAGRIVSLNTSGEWIMGVGTITANSRPMPFVLFQSAGDFDVVGDDGNFTGAQRSGVQNRITGVCVAQCAELQSTEYTTGVTYAPGELLTASDTTGLIVKTSGTSAATIIGVVSSAGGNTGLVVSEHSRSINRLQFHSVYALRF